MNNNLAVTITDPARGNQAQTLAQHLGLQLVVGSPIPSNIRWLLTVTGARLELREVGSKTQQPLAVDFLDPQLRRRLNHCTIKNELLARAVGLSRHSNLTIIDATAGWGIDAAILAELGCRVLMLERSPIIGSLLADGLTRYQHSYPNVANRLSLLNVDACDYLQQLLLQSSPDRPDVIYLDPMYPTDSRTALNRKPLRVLRDLVGEDGDAAQLLFWARQIAPRVVVKRPRQAAYLANIPTRLQFSSTRGSCRYDVYCAGVTSSN